MPPGTIEDHHGVRIGSDLAADLAEMMVHRGGIADWHDQRRRFALRWADRTKHIGRGEAEILGCCRPAAPKDLGFASASMCGAVCPSEGTPAALLMPICDTRARNPHLSEHDTKSCRQPES